MTTNSLQNFKWCFQLSHSTIKQLVLFAMNWWWNSCIMYWMLLNRLPIIAASALTSLICWICIHWEDRVFVTGCSGCVTFHFYILVILKIEYRSMKSIAVLFSLSFCCPKLLHELFVLLFLAVFCTIFEIWGSKKLD